MQKLTNNEELVLRLLYSNKMDSNSIPKGFFGEIEKDHLISLELVELNDGFYRLTEKAIEVIETGGFIVKYPLHNEKGVVMNFKDVLNSYGKEAAKALGLSIINTEFHKKWGKYINTTLLELLQDTDDFYRSYDHPIVRIESYKTDIDIAQSNYKKILNLELTKIKPFILIKPIPLLSSLGTKVLLLEYIDINTGVVSMGNNKLEIDFRQVEYELTELMKYQLIKQFYTVKSKSANLNKDKVDN